MLEEIAILPTGIPVQFLLFLSVVVVLPLNLVFGVASSAQFNLLVIGSDNQYMLLACWYSYILGKVVGTLFFGSLSDIFGRKQVLLAVLGVATFYVPLFISLGWAWNALIASIGTYAMLIVVPFYLALGLMDPTFGIAIASALDVSSRHTQLLSVLVVGILGLGFSTHTLQHLANLLIEILTSQSLGFLIPVGVTVFFVLAFVWVAAWKALPETLNAPVPRVASEESNPGTELFGKGDVGGRATGAVQEDDDPFEGAGRVKGSSREWLLGLIESLKYPHAWVAFWALGGTMVAALNLSRTTTIMFSSFAGELGWNNLYFPLLRGWELLVVQVIIFVILLRLAIKSPEAVIRFGYYRVILICTVWLLFLCIYSILASMVFALLPTEMFFILGRIVGALLLNVTLPLLFVATVFFALIMTNCGHRGEGGFYMGLFTAGHLSFSWWSYALTQLCFRLLEYPFWVYPLSYTSLVIVMSLVVALVYLAIRWGLPTNVPRDENTGMWEEPRKVNMLWSVAAGVWAVLSALLWFSIWMVASFVEEY